MNSERRLHLVVDLNSLGEKFVSAYSLDGIHILPPLMTDIKRMEMQQLRLQALAVEMTLKRNKPTIAEKEMKCLMPRMVNASTNTAMAENLNNNPNSNPKPKPDTVSASTSTPNSEPSPLVVIGRIRQELQKSQTAIFDYSTTELITIAPTTILPLLKASHEVIKDAPQRAVILPVELGTMKFSLLPKLNSSGPLQRSTDTIDLRVRTGQDRMPERPVVFSSSTFIEVASTKTADGRFRSRIPIRRQRATVLTPIQPPEVIVMSDHGSGHERNGMKTNSANERRRNYGAKVALKRNEMTKKREELAKLKPPPRTTNHQIPKSIRTPIRRVEGGESKLEKQNSHIQEPPKIDNNHNQVPKTTMTPIRRLESSFDEPHMEPKVNLFQSLDQQPASSKTNIEAGIEESELLNQMELFRSLASCQEAEQQRLQAQLEQEQQGLIDQLVGQIAHNDSQEIASEVTVGQ